MSSRQDFSNVTHTKAMLIINQKHLEMHEEKVTELKREKISLEKEDYLHRFALVVSYFYIYHYL